MRILPTLGLSAVALIALAGCAATATPSDDGRIAIVTSTNVYGDIASTIGGDRVSVTAIIDDPAQDPHSFEASARVQLALSKAVIVIENGGGYDDWAGTLLAGADNTDATVLDVTTISGYDTDPASGEFNEHLWYDFPTIATVAKTLVETLSAEDPSNAAVFARNGETFVASLQALERREAALKSSHDGTGVAITEPVPGYLLAASGLSVVTPPQFSEAIEEGTDVSPTVLKQTLATFSGGAARLLVYNEQTTGAETEQMLAAARAAGTPVVPVTETMPADTDYIDWMSDNLDAVESALQ